MSETDDHAMLVVHEFALGRRQQHNAFKMLMVIVLAMPLLGSVEEPKKVRLHNNVKRMKAEVLKRIPVGSSVEHAKAVMGKSGFVCEMMCKESFADYDEWGNRTTRKGDFLHCDKEKRAFPYIFFISRRWQIVMIYENRVVTRVLVSISLTGL